MMNTDDTFFGRRKFLTSVTGLAATSMLITLPGVVKANSLSETFTVKNVIDIILKEIPESKGDPTKPFQFLATSMIADTYKGRTATGKIYRPLGRPSSDVRLHRQNRS